MKLKRGTWVWHRSVMLLGVSMLLTSITVLAQTADGNAGLNQENTMIRSYYDTATNVMYAIAGLMGLVGAVEAYWKMRQGHEAGRGVIVWFLGCVFLALAATVIKSFFGL